MRYLCLVAFTVFLGVGCTRAPSSSQSGHSDATGNANLATSQPNSNQVGASPSRAVPTDTPRPSPAASSSADLPPSTRADVQAPSASAPSPSEPLPDVKVNNIGMHIGGGPNNHQTKAPIAESVKPHFDELRACWKYAQDKSKGGTFGVDLLIPRAGGKAQPSHPRSAIKGEGFEKCVLEVFERIEFKKPRTGKTMVSYSLRFTPGK